MYSRDELLKRRAALSSTKHKLLARQLRGQEPGAPEHSISSTTIPKRAPDALVPLSSIQERFWFLQQLDPTSTSYIITHAHALDYAIDERVLAQALRELVRRHEILRTTYVVQEGQVTQQINPTPHEAPAIPLIDLQHLPDSERAQAARRIVERERARPLQLELGPPWWAILIRLRQDYHILLLRMHHLITDGWSIDTIIQRELLALYRALLQGQPSPLPELSIQYADYAVWQRRQLQQGIYAAQLAYWTEHLAGVPMVLNLPTDYARPPIQAYRERTCPVRLPASLTTRLKQFSQHEQATLFMPLVAAFGVLLAQLAGQNDLLVGTSLAGRQLPELEPLLGCFISTLPLRIDMRDHPSFRVLVRRVREVCLGAYTNQDVPIQQIVAAIQPPRDLSRSPLYQVMFQMQNYPQFTLEQDLFAADTQPNPLELPAASTGQGMCDLAMLLYEGEEITGELAYDATLFTAETIARLVALFGTLLAAVATAPDCPVHQLPLTSDVDAQMHAVWNATEAAYPRHAAIHTLFERQAQQTPEAIALVWHDQQITYRQLDQRANQLGHHLLAFGIGPEACVGLCIERSPDAIIGMLAVLKIGGVYVPLDPTAPRERLAWILEDAQVACVLAHERQQPLLSDCRARLIRLDAVEGAIARLPITAPSSPVEPAQVAYIIYTSGSTGRPKGVMVQHRSLVNFSEAARRHYAITPDDRVLQFASLSFDASFEEIFPCLMAGATLVLRTDDTLDTIALFLGRCREWNISVLDLPTAYWHALTLHLSEAQHGLPATVRLVIIGGERALAERLALWQQRVGTSVRLVNSYGPTEATVIATAADLLPGQTTRPRDVPIGRPIQNTQIYILDPMMRPLPVGVPGEIYIGGAGLARGYLNQPGLTAERFVPNPFAKEKGKRKKEKTDDAEEFDLLPFTFCLLPSGDRLYKTGDRARYLPDGTIQFLGRLDDQVKLRGFRIEPGEIETTLARHPMVRQAVVLAYEDVPGDKRLVAYVVPNQEQSSEESHSQFSILNSQFLGELRAFLRERLPDYMIPSTFIALTALPLTPGGKVERRLLPHPGDERTTGYVAPSTAVEQELAAIWSAVLQRDHLGIHDNFFALGGHSLLAGQIIYRIRLTLQIDLPIHRLFEQPTIAGLAHAIQALYQHDRASPLAIDLRDDVVLDPSIRPAAGASLPMQQLSTPRTLFLTGATGFLGAFLLRDLLDTTEATIYCLVRATDQQAALKRIQRTMETYLLWDEAFRYRIVAVLGDLGEPLLGMPADQFAHLATEIDVIYHNGALVNFIYPYALTKAPNVFGTHEALRLACQAKLKPFHFVSTLSVFSSGDGTPGQPLKEDDLPARSELLTEGYAQSKWVAEQLVLLARERGLPTTIHRVGRIGGHSRTGAYQSHDFMWQVIKAILELGCVPAEILESSIQIVPVDYVSSAIVHLAHQPDQLGQIFHIHNSSGFTAGDTIEWLRGSGYPIRTISAKEWRTRLLEVAHSSSDSVAYTLVPFLPPESTPGTPAPPAEAGAVGFDCRNTLRALQGSSIICPEITADVFGAYVGFFRSIGFLQPAAEMY